MCEAKSHGQRAAIVSDSYSANKVPVKSLFKDVRHIRVESFKDDISNNLIECFNKNPNSAITLHKIEKYNAAALNAEQMQYYLEFIQGDIIEITVLLGGFYGMRRSECLGTRESQFDFQRGFFRANHITTNEIGVYDIMLAGVDK